jgi:hypothetical protein
MTSNYHAVLILSALVAPGAAISGCGSLVIGGDTPLENPPIENPLAESPPAEAPPAETPPAETPPAEDLRGKPDRVPCGPELHILGVYETNSDHSYMNHPIGTGTVHVDRKGPVVLALSSYEPVDWTVTVGPDTVLKRVILNGYHGQNAVVPAGVPIDTYDGEDGWLGAIGYAWPSAEGGSDTPALVAAIEGVAEQEMTSFHGCYHATSFVLNDNLSVTTDCAVDQGYEVTGYVEPATMSGKCDDPCAHASGLGTYVGSYCDLGHPFIITQDISCKDALSNCELNISLNPDVNLYCEWNDHFIMQGGPDTSSCIGANAP